MKDYVKRVLKAERERRGIPLEAKKIGGNYYLYQSTTVWDKAAKKRRKVSAYLGKITPSGLEEKKDRRHGVRTVFEYGNARALWRLAGELLPSLRKWFPLDYLEILAIGVVRVIQPTPMRLMKSRWEKLYLSKEHRASLSPNTLTEKLRRIGSDWASQKGFYEELLRDTRSLVFDLSCIFSHSENLRLAEKGYNARHLYLKQVNFALFFSLDRKVPVMLKPIPGSVRDIKSLKDALGEYDLSSYIIVLDRGLASYPLADLMAEEEMTFIMPLKRDFEIIDYDLLLRDCFVYRGRGINWGEKKVDGKTLYLFEDVKLRAEEETTFIEMVAEGKRKMGELEEERKRFGKIAVLTNIEEADGEAVYLLLKEREEVETAFDAMKNEMENDKTYLQDDDAVRGYFFTAFISLYLYHRLLQILRQHGLNGKISVNELLFELSKVYLIHYQDGTIGLSEIPAKAEKLGQLFDFDLFPKKL